MDWYRSISCYVAVVECGSFAKGAEQQMLTTSACSKRVSWLEKQLQVQLLVRTTRRLHVTEAGQQLFQQGKLWLSQFDQMRNGLSMNPGQLSGRLSIGAPPITSQMILTPIAIEFMAKYPNVTVEIYEIESGSLPDITHDLILSRTIPNYDAAGYRKLHLFDYAVKLYASPDFLRRHPNIQSVTDLKALPLLLVRAQLREGIKLNDGTVLRHGCQLHTDDPLVMVNAARMGLGILALSSDIIQKYLVSGELVEVLPELESERREFSAYYPAHPYQNPKTQAFLAHLRRARLNDSILPPR